MLMLMSAHIKGVYRPQGGPVSRTNSRESLRQNSNPRLDDPPAGYGGGWRERGIERRPSQDRDIG